MTALTMNQTRQNAFSPPAFSLGVAGVLALLIGAWGGIVPFVGPLFGFSGDGAGSWYWNLAHSLLFLAPGAIAVTMGLVIVSAGLRRHADVLADLAGLLLVVCGAWFVVGPFAWPVIEDAQVFRAAAPLRQLANWVGYSLGPGALLISLGAFVVGRTRHPTPIVLPDRDVRVIDEPVARSAI